jgi:TonB-dependent starch-binding outer membrane protein SusC
MQLTAIARSPGKHRASCCGRAQKITRVMRLTAIILLTACMAASASGNTQGITLAEKDTPLESIIKKIQAQSGYKFFYTTDVIQLAKPVTVAIQNGRLEQVLELCFKDQPITYTIIEKTVVIKRKPVPSSAIVPEKVSPLVEIRGRVVNERGEALEGITVSVKGTKKGTATDANGEFVLNDVEEDALLVFTSVSTQPLELKAGGNTPMVVTLKTKISSITEVQVNVNTGYQRISRERYVGSVATLDSAAFHRRDGMDIIGRLDGTVTGILIDKKKTGPAIEGMQIRGLSTVQNFTIPLVIVDNFPFRQSLDAINPNDVESVTVLRDAAATSIWGARAGNGVIVITTKKGKYNQAARVSISSITTVQEKKDLYYYPQMSIPDLIDIEQQLFKAGKYDGDLTNTNTWPIMSPVVELLAARRAGLITAQDSAIQIEAMKQADLRRDLNKYVYRLPVTQQHYINLSGGNNAFNYNFSGGYNRSLNGTRHAKADDGFTISTDAGFRPLTNLEITTSLKYSRSRGRGINFSMLGKAFPYLQLADAEGNALAVGMKRMPFLDTVGNRSLLDWKYRPLDEIENADADDLIQFVSVNAGISYRLPYGFSISASFQHNTQSANARILYNVNSYYARNLINTYTNLAQSIPNLRNPVPIGGILDIIRSESVSRNMRGQLNFNKLFAIKHAVASMIAAEVGDNRTSGDANRLYGYDKQNGSYVSSIDYATFFPTYGGIEGTKTIPNESRTLTAQTNRFVSFVGNVSYTYNSRYSIYASARKDGSNFFGVNTNRKWKPLWSSGLSWDISREKFFKVKWISSLRMRSTYGVSGNPGNISGYVTMNYSVARDQYSGFPIAFLNGAPNPDLKWENVRIINTAIDFSLWNNRISGSVDVFQKKCTDLIGPDIIPPSSGLLSVTRNVAQLSGHGFEISIISKNTTGAVDWQTNFGLSHARMVVDKVIQFSSNAYPKAQEAINYSINAYSGRVVYGIASYKWAGLDPATGNPRGYLNGQVSTNYNAIFNDTVGNQVFHGSSIPLYSGFVGNSFSWKRFTLSANITYRLKFYFKKPTIDYAALVGQLNGHTDYYQRWQKPGDELYTNIPSFTYPVNNDRELFYQNSEINILRGDNIRLQDIRLQYSWPANKTFKRISAYVYVNNLNLILWRKNKFNLDPDFAWGGVQIIPTPVTWTGGLSIDL